MIKRFIHLFAASLLATFSRGIISKYKPKIVMVTGSVGKTSTKDAIAAVLSDTYFLRKSEKSFNSEFGVPFTIIGARNPWTNLFAWLRVFRQAIALLLLPSHYPKLLILEVGADRPGDLARILRIATPDIVVVTRLPEVPVHVEAYTTPQALRDEEFAPAYALAPAAPLIISADDPHALAMAERLPVRVVTYGFQEKSQVHLTDSRTLIEKDSVVGMQADLHTEDFTETLTVRGSIGRQQLSPGAAALATALTFGISPSRALASMISYVPPPGRARIFSGLHNSVLIDDSYNSSPAATEEALRALSTFPRVTRRIAVLGDMLELGRYSVEEHERIGRLAAETADIVIAIGIRARGLAAAAQDAGLPEESVQIFDTAVEAIPVLAELLQKDDAILVKGSQSMRMERIVEMLLRNEDDKKQLVRQDPEWKRRP